MSKEAVIIVAGGKGLRLDTQTPKQYLHLHGKPILWHTIQAFYQQNPDRLIQVVIGECDHDLYAKSIDSMAIDPTNQNNLHLLPPVMGGETRQASVFLGLQALAPYQPTVVLIHDAARPFVSQKIIHDVLDTLKTHAAVIPAIPLVDTIKRTDALENIIQTIDRNHLWRAQTPQGFHYPLIWDLHHRLKQQKDLTDDASLCEAVGLPVKIISGDENNIKITTPADYEKACTMMNNLSPHAPNIRVGNGVDVHATEPGDGVWLMGVFMPTTFRLVGHSDADVGLHSLCDALFGAICDGDIGQHFPPTDPQWRGADSKIFLGYAAQKVRDKKGIISHVDVTILGERPKISPVRDQMREVVSKILDIPMDRVSIKATTTEKLGFIGREEGLMAVATATVILPS